MRTRHALRIAVAITLIAAFALPAAAVDVEKKWRVSLHLGTHNPQDEAISDAENRLQVLDPTTGGSLGFISDPRNDSSALGTFEIKPADRIAISGQYAFTKLLLLEVSAGYQTSDIGDAEVQAQFRGAVIPPNQGSNFAIFRVPVGEIEQVPVEVTAMARFRPRSKFNPFIGLGVGYTIVGFEPTSELDELSRRLDGTIGEFATLSQFAEVNSLGVNLDSVDLGTPVNLSGASVVAPDFFQWHAAGGAEVSFNRKWSMFFDLRFSYASRDLKVRFNGVESFGVAVPDISVDSTDPRASFENYGGFVIRENGLYDGGSLVPNESFRGRVDPLEWEQFCIDRVGDCEFDPTRLDGVLDPGIYYIKGGSIKYGGFTGTVGIRYTF